MITRIKTVLRACGALHRSSICRARVTHIRAVQDVTCSMTSLCYSNGRVSHWWKVRLTEWKTDRVTEETKNKENKSLRIRDKRKAEQNGKMRRERDINWGGGGWKRKGKRKREIDRERDVWIDISKNKRMHRGRRRGTALEQEEVGEVNDNMVAVG